MYKVRKLGKKEWCYRETGFAGNLVSHGNWFLVNLAKIFIIILVVKQVTYNANVTDTTILWFFKN